MVKKNFHKQLREIIICLFIILLGVWYMVYNMRSSEGMWRIFDDVHVVRTQEMVYELSQGQFPVRLLSRLGHGGGYMLFNFYSPLIYYLTSFLVMMGAVPLNAVKLVFQLCYLVAGLGMFGLLRVLIPKKPWIPVMGSLLLIGSTYFNYDAYTRGSLAELAGFALIPWLLMGYVQVKKTKRWMWVIFFAVIASAIIYTHAITAFITMPFIALFFLIDVFNKQLSKRVVLKLVLSAILALCLSASYIIPMWWEKSSVIYSQVDYVNSGYTYSFIPPNEILGWARSNDLNIKPNTVGLPLAFFSLIGLGLSWWLIKRLDKTLVIFITLSLGLVFFLQTRASIWLWEQSEILRMVQFPYRYQTLLTVIAVISGSIGLSAIKVKKPYAITAASCIILMSLYGSKEFIVPSGYYFAGEFKAEDPCGTTTWQHEYLSKWTTQCLLHNHQTPLATGSGELVVNDIITNETKKIITVKTNGQAGELVIGKYYLPGWRASSLSKQKETYPSGAYGLLTTKTAVGEYSLELTFADTQARSVGNTISLVSIMALLFVGLLRLFHFKEGKKHEEKNC
jgi:hypothetical protein